MIRSTLSATSISSCATTVTSGLSAVIVLRALSTFFSPIRSFVWSTWRWRFDRSTTSKSMIPSVPTPAAARYSADGGPRRQTPPAPPPAPRETGGGRGAGPAGPDEQRLRAEEPRLPLGPDLRDQQ